ncbi:MAG: DUF4011 domain-containing protein, partial [Deltaproteobacteria bacterium]|nr:DUF4011 domain-containing protein [Deltaproteobacteria bacterium]
MAAADLVRRNPKCPFVMHVSVLDTASVPICDFFNVIRSISVENRSRVYQAAAVALVESDPPFFKPFTLGFAEFRPWQLRDAPPASLEAECDWPYLASLESSRDAKVIVTLGRRDELILRQLLPVRIEPFWDWRGLGPLVDSLAFHARNAAPAVLADVMRGMLSGSADVPGEPWDVFPAAWETVRRREIFLEGVPGPVPTEPCDVLRPAALATRNSGTVLDMGLLLASLLDGQGVNTFLVFTEERLYLGVWLAARMFNAAWTEDLLTLHRCIKRGDVAIVDLAFVGPPNAVPELSKAMILSEKSIRDASFKGILDIGRAFHERDGRMKRRCPADVRLLFRYPPELLLPPAREADRGVPDAMAPPPPMPEPGQGKAEGVPGGPYELAPPSAGPPTRQAAPASPPASSVSGLPEAPDWQDCFPDEDFGFPPAGNGHQSPDTSRPEWFEFPGSPPSYYPGDSGPYWFETPVALYGQLPYEPWLGHHAPPGESAGAGPGPAASGFVGEDPAGIGPGPSDDRHVGGEADEAGDDYWDEYGSEETGDGGDGPGYVPVLDEDTYPEPGPAERRGRIGVWMGKLLDTTLRNSLLNYRPGGKSLELAVFSPLWLEDSLYEKKKFKIVSGPELLDRRREFMTLQDGSPRDPREALLCLSEDVCRERKLLAEHRPPDMEKRLLAMYRQARLDLQEGGANTLFLTLFRIRYRPLRSEAFCEAPLVLVPVSLERAKAGGAWRLSALEDEPTVNLTLLEILRQDFRMTGLDEFAERMPRNLDGPDLVRVAARAEREIRLSGRRGWRLLYRESLGHFSFAKHLMWKDLKELKRLKSFASPVALALAGDGPFREADEGSAPPLTPAALDERLDPALDFCPLPADSSQLAAVRRSADGGSFVLIGPPGTGKSQTIANIIAQALADGKSVLFVAEKAAALNVVHRRLKDAGLERFCLELHSNRTGKKDVAARLKESLGVEPDFAPRAGDWKSLSERVRYAAIHLDFYVSELHGGHPSGLDPYTAMEALMADSDSPEISLERPAPGGGRGASEGSAADRQNAAAGPDSSEASPDGSGASPDGSGASRKGAGTQPASFPFGSPEEIEAAKEALEHASRLLEPVRDLVRTPFLSGEILGWTSDRMRELKEAAESVLGLAARFRAYDAALATYGLHVEDGALEDTYRLKELRRL